MHLEVVRAAPEAERLVQVEHGEEGEVRDPSHRLKGVKARVRATLVELVDDQDRGGDDGGVDGALEARDGSLVVDDGLVLILVVIVERRGALRGRGQRRRRGGILGVLISRGGRVGDGAGEAEGSESRGARSARDGARRARTRGGCAAKRDAVRGSEARQMPNDIFVSRSLEDARHRASRERRGERRDPRGEQNVARRVECARGAVRATRGRGVDSARSVCALFYPRARFMKNIWMMVEVCEFIRWTPSARTVSPTWDLGSQRHRRSLRTAREALHPTRRARMVVIHCKGKSEEHQFLYETTVDIPVSQLVKERARHPNTEASDPATEGARE